MTKKWIALVLALVLCLGLIACGSNDAPQETHKIGVIVYNLGDEEVIGIREYLQGYIQKNFEMVEFIYSDSIRSAEQDAPLYEEKYRKFREKYNALDDGNASRRVVDILFSGRN